MNAVMPIGKAKPALCDLVDQAGQGKTTIISVSNKPKAQIGPVQSQSRKLTDEWRQRVKNIRLNRKGQKRLSLGQIIQESRP